MGIFRQLLQKRNSASDPVHRFIFRWADGKRDDCYHQRCHQREAKMCLFNEMAACVGEPNEALSLQQQSGSESALQAW